MSMVESLIIHAHHHSEHTLYFIKVLSLTFYQMKPATGKQRQPKCCLVAFVSGGGGGSFDRPKCHKSEGARKDSYLYWMSLMQTVGWSEWNEVKVQ